jgi:hypothetical protein
MDQMGFMPALVSGEVRIPGDTGCMGIMTAMVPREVLMAISHRAEVLGEYRRGQLPHGVYSVLPQ